MQSRRLPVQRARPITRLRVTSAFINIVFAMPVASSLTTCIPGYARDNLFAPIDDALVLKTILDVDIVGHILEHLFQIAAIRIDGVKFPFSIAV